MAKPDPLIRWETEALRDSAARRGPEPSASVGAAPRSRKKDAWVTLRDAHYETGLPVETLRKWARRNHVPSEVRNTEYGERRVVDLVAVQDRARQLGRPLAPIPIERRRPQPDDPGAAPAMVDLRKAERTAPAPDTAMVEPRPHDETETGATVVDVRLERVDPADARPPAQAVSASDPPGQAVPASDPSASEGRIAEEPPAVPARGVGAPPDTMIIPIAAWDKMLMQLGNLHQAGQQLAEARERAAKAETESIFLRERLTEMRGQLESAQQPDPPHPEGPTTVGRSTVETQPTAEETERLWRYIYRGWRERRR